MTRPRRRVYVHLTSTGPQETPDRFERGLVGFSRCHRTSHITRTLRVEARLASLVLRHLVRRVLLALLAESLLRFGNVHLGWKREDGGGGRQRMPVRSRRA